uniref:Ig-like domain-containing protein n=1 Tax=Acanthochromis polyacanthus TaxID=80966 RepID=A0A3Q1GKZ4_9TELE
KAGGHALQVMLLVASLYIVVFLSVMYQIHMTILFLTCMSSGLPDPAVRWSLPDGTMVNSVLHGEDRGGRARRLTVFDNGTLLVPAVGLGEEGEYTCYAENQGGQDTMKVQKTFLLRGDLRNLYSW